VIALVGFMGAGKSQVGGRLAERLRLPFVDTDHAIEAAAGRTIREIFATDGEPTFRELERETIVTRLDGDPAVLALGGGAVLDATTREALRANAFTIFLRVAFEEALARVGGDPGRPVLNRPDLRQVFEARQPVYTQVADLTVDTHGRSCSEIAASIAALIQDTGPAPRTVSGPGRTR
jgi:shikimate kinase